MEAKLSLLSQREDRAQFWPRERMNSHVRAQCESLVCTSEHIILCMHESVVLLLVLLIHAYNLEEEGVERERRTINHATAFSFEREN